MPPKRTLTPVGEREAKRARVLALYDNGKTRAEIQQATGYAKSTIGHIINTWGDGKRDDLKEHVKSGRPKMCTER